MRSRTRASRPHARGRLCALECAGARTRRRVYNCVRTCISRARRHASARAGAHARGGARHALVTPSRTHRCTRTPADKKRYRTKTCRYRTRPVGYRKRPVGYRTKNHCHVPKKTMGYRTKNQVLHTKNVFCFGDRKTTIGYRTKTFLPF